MATTGLASLGSQLFGMDVIGVQEKRNGGIFSRDPPSRCFRKSKYPIAGMLFCPRSAASFALSTMTFLDADKYANEAIESHTFAKPV